MALTVYKAGTMTDPVTGRTTVTVAVDGPQSQHYQWSWVSGAAAVALGPAGSPNAMLGNSRVQAEVNVGGPALLAAVNAGTVPPGLTVIANPDPSGT